jgi:hypothetical protein
MPYLLVENIPPHCKECGNENGMRGTPCVNCELRIKFNKEWTIYLWTSQFAIYKSN